jgi:3'(2'), 5'-bisphosphate nucleotidase
MSPGMTDNDLLALAARLAREAGEAILEVRARSFETLRKHDDSPVTEADHAAERIIVAGLRAALPEVPVVAEEEIAAGHVPAQADAFWLVDPLDGTREFVNLRDDFVVNIGLMRGGRPALGVVGVPATGEIYGGIVGQGAWKRDAAGERAIRVRRAPPEGLTVMASRSHANEEKLAEFLHGKKIAAVTNIGSALKFCRLAEGLVDCYPRFGRTMEWDTGAPQAVVEAAGGSVRTLEGAPLLYGKPGWENPHFICFGAED